MDAILAIERCDLRCSFPGKTRPAFYCNDMYLRLHGFIIWGDEMVDRLTIPILQEALDKNRFPFDHAKIAKQLIATMQENAKLREACNAVDELWTGDEKDVHLLSFRDEAEMWDSPVGRAWKKVRDALAVNQDARSEYRDCEGK